MGTSGLRKATVKFTAQHRGSHAPTQNRPLRGGNVHSTSRGAWGPRDHHISLLWESSPRGAQAGTETDPDQQDCGSYTTRTFLPSLAIWNLPLFLGKHCHSPELPSAENVLCPLLPGNQYSWAFYKLSLCWPKGLDRHPQNGAITSARRSKKGLKHVKNNAFTHLESLPQIFKRWWVDGCVIKQVSKMLIRKLSGGYIGIYYKILSVLVYLWNFS